MGRRRGAPHWALKSVDGFKLAEDKAAGRLTDFDLELFFHFAERREVRSNDPLPGAAAERVLLARKAQGDGRLNGSQTIGGTA